MTRKAWSSRPTSHRPPRPHRRVFFARMGTKSPARNRIVNSRPQPPMPVREHTLRLGWRPRCCVAYQRWGRLPPQITTGPALTGGAFWFWMQRALRETANDRQNGVGCYLFQKQDCSCADPENDGNCLDHDHVSFPPNLRGKVAPGLFPPDFTGLTKRLRTPRR